MTEFARSLKGYSLSPASPDYLLGKIREAIIDSIQSNLQIVEVHVGHQIFNDYLFLNDYKAVDGVVRSKNGMTLKLDGSLKRDMMKVYLEEAASQ